MAQSIGNGDNNQGGFEAEVIFEVNAPHPTSMPDCKKNPKHVRFIPAKDFTKENLPADYRDDDDIFKYIQIMAELTVCLNVYFVSRDRPETFPKSRKPYPSRRFRGMSAFTRTGTGFVLNVYRDNDLETPKWAITVMTVRHVTFDKSEVVKTKCCFHFDESSSECIELYGERVKQLGDVDEDYILFVCHTSNDELATTQKKRLSDLRSLLLKINEEHNCKSPEEGALAVIVSHPHGFSKHISVGRLKEKKRANYNPVYTIYKYDTPTCPGSSGAPLWVLGMQSISLYLHPHSKAIDEFNESAVALEKTCGT